ncbi:MAG: glycosyltransferase family 4 protein [Candidatus Omnitrophica bacterium]|nr:glycosyltransferase family 4 protein [Candidatus Omnitrophota bacterium]
MKKILILNYEYPPLGGGAGNALYYMLQEFKHLKDISIDVIASSSGKYTEHRIGDNINVYLLDIGKKGDIHFQSSKDILQFMKKGFFFSKNMIKKNKYDMCHAFFGIPCGFIAMLLGIEYIVSLRGTDVPFYNKRFELLDRFVLRFLNKNIWRKAKGVYANSHGLKELAQKTDNKTDIKVIPNGINIDEYEVVFNDNKCLKFLCVSRLIKRKGIETLLRAFSNIKHGSRPLLTIVGSGNEKERLIKLSKELGVNERVQFLGYIEHSALKQIYRSNDVFVLPSENEGMSNAVLEAMACGLPIIMTNTGGAKELIKDNGFVVEKNDIEQLQQTMEIFIEKKEDIRIMGIQSRLIAEKNSWKEVVENYMRVYNEITH